MHSLANLVVWTKLYFLLPEYEETKMSKFFVHILSKITSEPETPGSWKRGKHAKWFVPWEIWAGVAPCAGHFQKNCEIWQRQDEKNQKIRTKHQFSRQVFVLETSQTPLYTLQEVLNKSNVRDHAAPSNPCWDKGRQNKKSQKMAIFGPKNWVFGQQNDFCRQNATRDLFLYHQKGAACKIWANPDCSFSRSGVEWNKRLKLNFWYRTRAGGPTPPSKVRVDRWGRPPRHARLNRWLGARR